MRCNLSNQFICTLVLSLALAGSASAYGGGTGEPNDPWQIWTAAQMNTIGTVPGDWGKCFRLMADIDMAVYSGTQYNIIGNSSNPFMGTFDGNGHVIANLHYETTAGAGDIGLFGCIGNMATVRDLGVESARIVTRNAGNVGILAGSSSGGIVTGSHATGLVAGYIYVGGLVGQTYSGTISDCYVSGSVVGDYSDVGGLIGYVSRTTVTRCCCDGLVSGYAPYMGGLVGYLARGTITDSYSISTVIAEPVIIIDPQGMDNDVAALDGTTADLVGGLIGYTGAFSTTVANCYAGGSVTGDDCTGGLIGLNRAIVDDCYSTGAVTSAGIDVGGLIGQNGGTVNNCFWDTDTSHMPTSAGGTGRTTTQMQDPNTFVLAGWDLLGEIASGAADTWRICADDVNYPHLTWEYVVDGDFACPDGVAFDDLARLASDWLLTYSTPLYGADATGDGTVNFTDFAVLAENWMQGA